MKCFAAVARDAEVWLVTRRDVRRLPHVRAFVAAIEGRFRASRARILGEG